MFPAAGRLALLLVILVGLCSLQAGCGQKGKLYLPDKTTEQSSG